jgi:hypothetical protein
MAFKMFLAMHVYLMIYTPIIASFFDVEVDLALQEHSTCSPLKPVLVCVTR